MNQVLQSLQSGKVELADVPASRVTSATVLIRTRRTLISPGTERMLLQFGQANVIGKLRQQPDKVQLILNKAKTDGLISTMQSVRTKLDAPVSLGYSNVGVVIDVGEGVTSVKRGDRVVSNGAHAELVRVGQNLCAKVPDNVSDDGAAFAVIGAIALQGIRLADPKLGETFAVAGLGLIGLLAVQILRANGCRVIALDFDPKRLELAQMFGAESISLRGGLDPVSTVVSLTSGIGVDGVLITAATKSSDPIRHAAGMCRKRGRIVLVGVSGLNLARDDFYKKELTFQVSCSSGPGRYDPVYEQQGRDYPLPYVRWTEQRNIEAVLQLISRGQIDTSKLVTHRFSIGEVDSAYDLLSQAQSSLGILLDYPSESEVPEAVLRRETIALHTPPSNGNASVALIGAGSFASKVLIPALRNSEFRLEVIASSGGVSARHWGRRFGFARATTDLETIFSDSAIHAVVIATRHDTHASIVHRCLVSGKHVYVEKPLCISREELNDLEYLYRSLRPRPVLMVGFNRRFSPLVVQAKHLLSELGQPSSLIYTVNAGLAAPDHWTQLPDGGGRIVGEACHFIDLMRFIVGSPIRRVAASSVGNASDTLSIKVEFEDASCGTVHYFSNGHNAFPKERLEVFCGGRILQIDNFRKLTAFGWPRGQSRKLWRQDKGHSAAVAAFSNAVIHGQQSPIPFEELVEVANATFDAAGK